MKGKSNSKNIAFICVLLSMLVCGMHAQQPTDPTAQSIESLNMATLSNNPMEFSSIPPLYEPTIRPMRFSSMHPTSFPSHQPSGYKGDLSSSQESGYNSLSASSKILYIVNILGTLIGCPVSLLLMWLIKRTDSHKSDYNTLLYWMSVFEFIAFTQFFTENLQVDYPNDNGVQKYAQLGYLIYSCALLASYTISSVLSYMLCSVIVFRTVTKLKEIEKTIIALVVIPSLTCFILSAETLFQNDKKMAYTGWMIGESLIMIPVIFNIMFYVISSIKAAQIGLNKSKTKEDMAIEAALSRYKWYPILQILARIPITTFLFLHDTHSKGSPTIDDVYLFDFSDGDRHDYLFGLYLFANLTMIFATIGFLIIFVVMNPKAQSLLLNTFCGSSIADNLKPKRPSSKIIVNNDAPSKSEVTEDVEMSGLPYQTDIVNTDANRDDSYFSDDSLFELVESRKSRASQDRFSTVDRLSSLDVLKAAQSKAIPSFNTTATSTRDFQNPIQLASQRRASQIDNNSSSMT